MMTSTSTRRTIEEREEYEPHIDNGVIVYAGVDYEKILRQAEKEVDIVLWDGGNNDFPFYVSDLQIVVADPHRPGHESDLLPRRDQRAHGGCVRHQQSGYGRPGECDQGAREPAPPESEGNPDRSRLPALCG